MSILEKLQEATTIIERYNLQSVIDVRLNAMDTLRIQINKREELHNVSTPSEIVECQFEEYFTETLVVGEFEIICLTYYKKF